MLIQSTRRPQVNMPGLKAEKSRKNPPSDKPDPVDSTSESNRENPGPLSGQAGQRVGHFVREVTAESLQHLRYLSVSSAFGQIGSTAGSLAMTPLAISFAKDNAALIGGLAIGGTVAAGAIGAGLGYLWLYQKDGKEKRAAELSKLSEVAISVGAGLQALPKFIYPSVVGATEAQTQNIYAALDRLPLHQATASATMQVVPDLLDTGISGMAQPGSSHTHILLDESRVSDARRAQELVLHEQAHAVDYSGGFGLVGAHNWKAGFGTGPFVSGYAESNRYEDFAESFEAYNTDPAGFAAKFPEKAAAIERISHPDLISGAADRPAVREAGKKIGATLGQVPYLRTGLALAGSLLGPIQVYRGANKLSEALESGDEQKKLDGKLALATGLFLGIPGAKPLALATSLAGAGIKMAGLENGGANFAAADAAANAVLSASAGPVGMAAAAIVGELKANGMDFSVSQGFTPDGWSRSRPKKATMLKGTLATVGGTVAGALVGAAVGGALSGNTGAVMGALWGQVAGGALGLGGYSIHRVMNHSDDPQNPLSLTDNDKRFVKRTLAGAALGGTAGTLGGATLGRMAGQALGMAVADAGAASVLSSVGGWVGGLSGAFGGAKLGAGLGSGRLLGRSVLEEPSKSFET